RSGVGPRPRPVRPAVLEMGGEGALDEDPGEGTLGLEIEPPAEQSAPRGQEQPRTGEERSPGPHVKAPCAAGASLPPGARSRGTEARPPGETGSARPARPAAGRREAASRPAGRSRPQHGRYPRSRWGTPRPPPGWYRGSGFRTAWRDR